MKKRTLALFLAVVMILSVCAMGIQVAAAEEQYKVGYAIKDINPWKDPANPNLGLITHYYGEEVGYQGLKLSGRGANDNKRFCVGIWDDDCDGIWYGKYYYDSNGDGVVDPDSDKTKNMFGTQSGNGRYDPDDGLFTTCTAITDAKGNTVLLISLDALGAFGNLTSDVRAQILKSVKANPAAWGNANVTFDAIIINGSHTHSSLRFSDTSVYGSYEGNKNSTDAAKKYYNRVVDQIVAAAKEACQDRAEATMYKSSVDVSAVLPAKGITNNSGVTNLQLNYVRQYNLHYIAKIEAIDDDKTYEFDVIAGSNFGWREGIQKFLAEKYADEFKNKVGRDILPSDVTVSSTRMQDKNELVSVNGKEAPADDMLHLIEFRFAENSGKNPIAMINWRAHTTENGGEYFGAASSDYVGPLRTLLGKEENGGYRVAFFLGAAGNLTIDSRMSSGYLLTPWRQPLKETIWDDKTPNSLYNPKWKSTVHLYADLLKRAALTKLGGKGTEMTDLGDIRVATSTFYAPKQTYSEGWVKALEDLLKVAEVRGIDWQKNSDLYPHRYLHTDGEVYIIASYFHANTINGRKNTALGASQGVTLSAVALGNAAAFVAAPYELSDRYYDHLENGDLSDNDWNELKDIIGTGSPFVLSCANNYISYLPGSLEYIYNTQEFYDIFSKNNKVTAYRDYAKDGPLIYGPGNYESHISPLARGAGEMMIDHFGEMLRSLKDGTQTKPTYCDKCQQDVIWQPITNDKIGGIDGGHYYLTENVTRENGSLNTVEVGRTLCFDLKGHKYEVNDKAFHLNNTSTLNITDSVGGGEIVSHVADTVRGTAIVTATSATLNLYGGTLSCDATPFEENPAARTVYNLGTFNMYGGTIKGGKVISGQANSNYHDGCGATVYMGPKGNLNVYGGTINAGDAEVAGDCVYLSAVGSKVMLSGNAHIDEIYVKEYNDEHSQLTVEGGTANLVFESDLKSGDQIGKGSDASGLNVIKPEGVRVRAELGALILDSSKLVAQNGNVGYYDLNTALLTYKSGEIQLLDNVTDDVFAYNNAIIDLNGFDITGKVTVPEGKTIYCKDSATDDYDIEDGVYGKISVYTGDIQPVRAGMNNADKDYLKVTENDGISFHCVNLKLTHVTLTPEKASIKYKAAFEGDRLVAENVKQFGIAFNLRENPNATNMVEGTYSKFYTFAPGANANGTKASTSVIDIMQITQTEYINGKNAKMPIYGSAYVLTNDGEYLFGEAENKTFRQVVQDVDARWSSWSAEQKTAAVEMYKRFEGNMKYWDLTNIQQAAAQ